MSHAAAPPPRSTPVRYGSRDGSGAPAGARPCPVCATPVPSARARYCSDACKQRAYRLRLGDRSAPALSHLVTGLDRAGDRRAHTVYGCPACETRSLGERRCPECHRFCRKLGPGGACPHCDEPILLADLLGTEVLP
jgi:predicted nucleic acid-binding Zn ribbon protein